MKIKRIEIDNFGDIDTFYNTLTGRFKFKSGESISTRISKTSYKITNFQTHEELYISIEGSFLKGYQALINQKYYVLVDPIPWYMFAIIWIPFIVSIVCGLVLPNFGYPYVGGLIGGVISGLFTALSFFFCLLFRNKKWIFVLLQIPIFIIMFLTCSLVGFLIVAGGKALLSTIDSLSESSLP